MGDGDQGAELLEDPQGSVRSAAAGALRSFRGAATKHVKLVAGLLKDPAKDGTCRREAACTLGFLGSAATASANDIAGLLEDSNSLVRCAAAEALGRLGGPGAKHA